jgi:hypothetical protein
MIRRTSTAAATCNAYWSNPGDRPGLLQARVSSLLLHVTQPLSVLQLSLRRAESNHMLTPATRGRRKALRRLRITHMSEQQRCRQQRQGMRIAAASLLQPDAARPAASSRCVATTMLPQAEPAVARQRKSRNWVACRRPLAAQQVVSCLRVLAELSVLPPHSLLADAVRVRLERRLRIVLCGGPASSRKAHSNDPHSATHCDFAPAPMDELRRSRRLAQEILQRAESIRTTMDSVSASFAAMATIQRQSDSKHTQARASCCILGYS